MSENTTNGMVVSESFIIAVVGIASACVGGLLSFLLKSRCRTIKCCGIECEREVLSPSHFSNANIEIQSNK